MKKFMLTASAVIFLLIFVAFRPGVPSGSPPDTNLKTPFIDFGLADQDGVFHQLGYYGNYRAVALFVQGNGCPIVRNALGELTALRDSFESRGIKFLMLNANLQDDAAEIQKEVEEFGIDLPVLVDRQQLVAQLLDLRKTAEVLLIDMQSRKLRYRGPVSDRLHYEAQRQEAGQRYLQEAMEAVLENRKVETPVVTAVGCSITRLSDKWRPDVTYVQDVAPILQQKCVQCHQEGGVAPWAMKDYRTIVGWSSMISNVLNTKRMPPWHADPKYGHFSNDLSLSDEELQTLTAWLAGDLVRGEGEDPLEKREPLINEWILGEPDLVLDLKSEAIPATGIIDYRYQSFKLRIKKDVYVRAVEVQPDKTEVLHHVLATLEYPKGFQIDLDRKRGPWIDGILAAWAPGTQPEVFPEGTGRIIPKGSIVHIQLHYTTNGKAQKDASRIGFHFLEGKPEREYFTIGPSDFDLAIQPNEANYRSKISEKIYDDIRIYAFFPHMHYRGKSMKYILVDPSGKRQTLLSVPNYNFNWQRYYVLDQPLDVRKGSKILVEAVFDNSPQNRFNPNPGETVYYGEQTFDEMMIGFFSYHKL